MKAGNLIKDNDAALVTILQTSPIYVSFGVPEQLLPEVRKYSSEHPVLIEASADGQKTVTGTLRFIDNSVDNTTGMIKLKALFDNPDRVLWPGQFVNVQARLRLEHNRIVVPSRTVQTGPQGKYVWVMNQTNGTVAMRPVQVLRNYQPAKTGEEAVIGNGLTSGEMVISEGQMRLAPGVKVRLLKSNTELGDAGRCRTRPAVLKVSMHFTDLFIRRAITTTLLMAGILSFRNSELHHASGQQSAVG